MPRTWQLPMPLTSRRPRNALSRTGLHGRSSTFSRTGGRPGSGSWAIRAEGKTEAGHARPAEQRPRTVRAAADAVVWGPVFLRESVVFPARAGGDLPRGA